MQQQLAKKLALAGLVIAGVCLLGCILGQATQLYTPLATIIAGCIVALAVAELGQR